MADKKKGIGDALLGLFVVREGETLEPESAAPATGDPAVDDLIARYANASSVAPSVPSRRERSRPPQPLPGVSAVPAMPLEAAPAPSPPAEPEPTAVPDVKVDFAGVLRKGGLSEEEQGRVEKALTLLHNLPAQTPIELKRQIASASLQAFGISIDQILESALLHIALFDRHVRAEETETERSLEQGNRRLNELEQEAARIKQAMQETRAHQQGLTMACSRQKMRIHEVLDFFGPEAVERVKQISIKLRDRQDS